jgi:WhiB family redox-sensing transcriptional regulator
MNTTATTEWRARANCMGIDPTLFFPQLGADTERARQVCVGCVVRQQCLDHAIVVGDRVAIMGGLSAAERQRLAHPSARRGGGGAMRLLTPSPA